MKPLLFMGVALIGIIITLHATTAKTVKADDCCNSKQISTDVLNAISVKLM